MAEPLGTYEEPDSPSNLVIHEPPAEKPKRKRKGKQITGVRSKMTKSSRSDERASTSKDDEHDGLSLLALTAANIKSIVYNVVKNPEVQAMIKNTLEEDNSKHETAVYEPKMTRAKLKEVMKKEGNVPLAFSPWKEESKNRKLFADLEFSEEDDDEEYIPDNETETSLLASDDDEESLMSSHLSDFGSPCVADSPSFSINQKAKLYIPNLNSKQDEFDLPASSEHPSENFMKDLEELDLIRSVAFRTRSRRPLTHTSIDSIEREFIPPDITPDMYGNTLDETEDDPDWKNFLTNLFKEDVVCEQEEDEEDPEYNVLADCELEGDDDGAPLRVPKTELTQLLEELYDMDNIECENEDDTELPQTFNKPAPIYYDRAPTAKDLLDMQRALQVEVKQVTSLPPGPKITFQVPDEDERIQIQIQMQKHIQLLAQHAIISESTNDEHHQQSTTFLKELNMFAEKTHAVGKLSYFNQPNLKPALEMVESYKYTKDTQKSNVKGLTKAELSLMVTSPVFIYPELLPKERFIISDNQINRKRRTIFHPSEDLLIVMGVHEFQSRYEFYLDLINQYLLPLHSWKSINMRMRNLSKRHKQNNPVHIFKKTKIYPEEIVKSRDRNSQTHTAPILRVLPENPAPWPSWLKEMIEMRDKHFKNKIPIHSHDGNASTVLQQIYNPPVSNISTSSADKVQPACQVTVIFDAPPISSQSSQPHVQPFTSNDVPTSQQAPVTTVPSTSQVIVISRIKKEPFASAVDVPKTNANETIEIDASKMQLTMMNESRSQTAAEKADEHLTESDSLQLLLDGSDASQQAPAEHDTGKEAPVKGDTREKAQESPEKAEQSHDKIASPSQDNVTPKKQTSESQSSVTTPKMLTTPTSSSVPPIMAMFSELSKVMMSSENAQRTPKSLKKTPTKLRQIFCSPTKTPHKEYVPLPKTRTEKSQENIQKLRQHAQSIIPKSFIPTVFNPSPTKKAARAISERAMNIVKRKFSPVKSPSKCFLNTLQTGRSKLSRDKSRHDEDDLTSLIEASSVTTGKSTKKHRYHACLAPDILENDPRKSEREDLLSQWYISKVKQTLGEDSTQYMEFLQILINFGKQRKNPSEFYTELKNGLFSQHKDLLTDFSAFLLPQQAISCGEDCYKLCLQFNTARKFLRKLEVFFGGQTATFQRLMRMFSTKSSDPQTLSDNIKQILNRHPALLEDFNTFFPQSSPAKRHVSDYEVVDLTDIDEDLVFDGYETMELPEVEETNATSKCTCSCHYTQAASQNYKDKLQHCLQCQISVIHGRLYIHTMRGLKPAYITYINPDSDSELSPQTADSDDEPSSDHSIDEVDSPILNGRYSHDIETNAEQNDLHNVNNNHNHVQTNEWRRHEDQIILEALQQSNDTLTLSPAEFVRISNRLQNRTPAQVERRYGDLMELLGNELVEDSE